MRKRILSIIISIFSMISIGFTEEIRVSIDNDLFYKSDSYYTHGTAIAYSYPIKPYTNWMGVVSHKKYTLAQYMYTPTDIRIPEFMPEDRPYGGVLYIEDSFYIESENRMQSYAFLGGTVGPHSYSEEAQKFVHKVVGSNQPMGWEYQIKDEPVLNALYQDRHRFIKNDYFNLIGNYGGAVGNVHIFANLGILSKFGYNVPNDYDIIRLEPLPRKWNKLSIYGFTSLEGRIVGRNVFLDGNLISDSHRVDKEYFVGDFIAGMTISLYNIDMTYSSTWRTKEFKAQEDYSHFGSLSIAYKW